jgi:HEAT repeat protein
MALVEILGNDAFEMLTSAVRSDSAIVREGILHLLGEWSDVHKRAVPIMLELLQHDPVAQVRSVAALWLCRIAPNDFEVAERLRAAMKDEDSNVRIGAAAALCRQNPVDAAALQLIVDATESGDLSARRTAVARAREFLAPSRNFPVAPFLSALHDSDELDARIAAMAVGRLGEDAIIDLVNMLRNRFEIRAHCFAVRALSEMGPRVIGEGKHGIEVRDVLCDVIEHMNRYDVSCIEEDGRTNSISSTLGWSASLLSELAAPGDSRVANCLGRFLSWGNDSVAIDAARGLERIGAAAKPQLAALRSLLTAENCDLWLAATSAIKTIEQSHR